MATVNTRISPTGTISRRTAGRRMQHRVVTARLLREAFMDITDGDHDNRKAASIMMQLQEVNLLEYHVDALQYDGDLSNADKAAEKYLLSDESAKK